MAEMHILAYIYHWGRDEIRKIPRRERRLWVERIVEQKQKENKAQENSIAEARANANTPRR